MRKNFTKLVVFMCLMASTKLAFADLPYHPIEFPRDEGGHFENTPYFSPYIIEWWYFNGEVQSFCGDSFSYYVALFAVKTPQPDGTFLERYSAHMHVSNLDEQVQIPGRASFTPETATVSMTDLDINFDDAFVVRRIQIPHVDESLYVLHATALDYSETTEIEIALLLRPERDPLLVGGDGLVDMPDGGNSYYYSFSRMNTLGHIRIGDEYFPINPFESTSWMDHQWGDFFPTLHGWEWFSVRLDNGLDANVFVHFLNETGEVAGGTASFILPDGRHEHIELDESFDLGRDDYYISPYTGESYAMSHLLSFPEIDLELEINALFPEQDNAIWLWEGYNEVDALYQGIPSQGFAYMEIVYPHFLSL